MTVDELVKLPGVGRKNSKRYNFRDRPATKYGS